MASSPKLRKGTALGLGLALTLASCASDERPFLLPPDAVQAATPTTAVSTTGPTPPTTADPGEPLALITPTGVVVPILEVGEGGYLVQTPCQEQATLTFGTPLREVDVVLDPGHGGEIETGAVGPNGLTEKDLNLRLSKLTALRISERGFTVALTRTNDYRVPLITRAQIADTLKAEALISIHHNAPVLADSDTPGSEIFYQTASLQSARLGGLIQEEVLEALSAFDDVDWVSAADAGVLGVLKPDGTESYGMIRRPETTAVLAELGYLANPSEAELFASDEYVEVAAEALANAVERFLSTNESGVAPNDQNRTFTPTGGTGGVAGCTDPALE
ncbi:MAG: N-acetylmuramoyl-L-alanine amidase [Acidimicrobiales bacterium]|nr:N-acetylmuramoyl-L-alanine amidase [Acidimicrobiales bacterium]